VLNFTTITRLQAFQLTRSISAAGRGCRLGGGGRAHTTEIRGRHGWFYFFARIEVTFNRFILQFCVAMLVIICNIQHFLKF